LLQTTPREHPPRTGAGAMQEHRGSRPTSRSLARSKTEPTARWNPAAASRVGWSQERADAAPVTWRRYSMRRPAESLGAW